MDSPNDLQHRDPASVTPAQAPEKIRQDARTLPRPLLFTVATVMILLGIYFVTGMRWKPHSAQDPAMQAGMSIQEDIKDAKKNIPLESKGVTTTPTNNADAQITNPATNAATSGSGGGERSPPAQPDNAGR